MIVLALPACSASSRQAFRSRGRTRGQPRATFLNMRRRAVGQRFLHRLQHGQDVAVMVRSEGKPRIGSLVCNGSSPIWTIFASAGGGSRLGIHGTSVSKTMIRSASFSNSPGADPWNIGWLARQREIPRVVGIDRQRVTLREPRQRHAVAWIAPQHPGDDQGIACSGDPVRELFDIPRRRLRIARSGPMRAIAFRRAHRFPDTSLGRLKYTGPRRERVGHFHRAIDDGAGLVAALHFVVPLDHLTQHAGLVIHLLRPMDVGAAGTFGTGLGEGRAAGGQQHRELDPDSHRSAC